MGVVYLAEDRRLKRKVALKLLAPRLAEDERFGERLLAESELAASLDHPNIVPIYEAGEADGRIFISMRYVDGQSLKQLLKDGPLAPDKALALVSQVASALDAAHARGLVHRDVKPSNVLIAPTAGHEGADHVYLADFGLSRRLDDVAAGEGRSLGTVDYVAPEQIRGEEVDGRVDLYSLGCLLYECLAGRPPFARVSETQVLFAHLEDDPPTLAGLEEVFRRALAKSPDERYQSGRELVEAARAALGLGKPRPAGKPVALAAVCLALVAAGVGAFLASRGGGSAAEPGADSLVRIDPATNRVTRTTPVGPLAGAVATDDRYVWVTSSGDGTVWRIDPRTRQVLKLSAQGTPTAVAVRQGRVIVGDGPEHKVVVLDAASGTASFAATLSGSGDGTLELAAGGDGVWFGDSQGGSGIVAPVDAVLSSGTPSAQLAIRGDHSSFVSSYNSFDGLAAGEGGLWLAGDVRDHVVWRLDPGLGGVVATVGLPFIPSAIAAGEGAVWVTSLLTDQVARIDPATDRIVATIPVGRGPYAIAAGDGAVWVTSAIDDSLWRIDPATNRVDARIPLAGAPRSVAVGAGGVWVTTAQPVRAETGAIAIGVYADCQGVFGPDHADSLAGAELPLVERGGKVGVDPAGGVTGVSIGGRPVRLYFGCDRTNGGSTTTQVLMEARRLVEQVGVAIVIAPTATPDELALQRYARLRPETAFVDGAGAAPNPDPAPNFFKFNTDGRQWMAGLGSYAYDVLGWRRAITVGYGGDAFFWGQPAAFDAEFCALGGKIVKRIWYPVYTSDYSSVIAQIPRGGIDGILVDDPSLLPVLATSDPSLRGNLSRKVIVTTAAAQAPLYKLGARAAGIVTAGPTLFLPNADARPGLAPGGRYRTEFARAFPQIPAAQIGSYDLGYYNGMTAIVQALDGVHGNLSGGERAFMAALAKVKLDSPAGELTLDARHLGVAPNFVWQLRGPKLVPHVIRTIPRVDPSFGGYFKPTDPPPSPTTPACVRRTPPPWGRSAP